MSTTTITELHRATKANGKQCAFESTTCSRCCGIGRFGPASVFAGRCFKCSGTGVTMTKRGAAAQQFYRELLSKRVDEVQPGDKILDEGCPGITAGGWRLVNSVERAADRAARGERVGGSIYTIDQIEQIERAIDEGATCTPTTYRDRPAYTVASGYIVDCGDFGLNGYAGDHLVRVARTNEFKVAAMAQAREFELTLTKTGQPRKR